MIARIAAAGVIALDSVVRADFIAPMPPHDDSFSPWTRGYYFRAPAAFEITGVMVLQHPLWGAPTMNFAVVRFLNGPPPRFGATTNDFQTLAVGLDAPSDNFAPVSATVNAGDLIGVYGNVMSGPSHQFGQVSYADARPNETTIFGQTVSLTRSGMQYHLGSAGSPQMREIWREGNRLIGRVEFCYRAIPAPASALALAGLVAGRRRRAG